MITVKWTGAAGLEFTFRDRVILVDPYISRVGKTDVFFRRLKPAGDLIKKYVYEMAGRLTSVVVSHTHFDHALDIPELADCFEGPLAGSKSLETLMGLHGKGGRVTVCDGETEIPLFKGASLTMIPSKHGVEPLWGVPYPGEIDSAETLPMKAGRYRHGQVFIVRLEVRDRSFIHVSSANFIEDRLKGKKCDVLFLCVPGWRRVPGYPERIIELTTPEIVVPFHYDDFTVPLNKNKKTPRLPFAALDAFIDAVSTHEPGVKIMRPEPHETMEF